MDPNVTDRIAAAAAGKARPAARRTAAQREAARRNGRRGRGPTTAAGKAASRLNALKHGLMARVVCPPADSRGHHELYLEVRRRLAEEFSPATFTASAALDALAADYVQLARAVRLTEALQRPAEATRQEAGDEQDARQAAEWRQDLALLGKAMGRLAGQTGRERRRGRVVADTTGDTGAAGQAGWGRLAGLVAGLVSGAVADLAQADAEAAEEAAEASAGRVGGVAGDGGGVDAAVLAFEARELEALRSLVAALGGSAGRLGDVDHLTAVFRGTSELTPCDRAPLVAALSELRDRLRGLLAGLEGAEARAEASARRREGVAEDALAADPRPLLLLRRYQSSIERAIELKLRRIERRHR